MKIKRKLFGSLLILALAGLVIWLPADLTSTAQQIGQRSPAGITLLAANEVQTAPGMDHWVSEPVSPVFTLAARDIPPSEVLPTLDREINPRMNFGPQPEKDFDPPSKPDPLLPLQEAAPAAQISGIETPLFNFDGQGYTFLNPPDTVGAVGKDHFIQMINATRVAIYNKATGDLVIPTFPLSALGGCATGWGDPIVLYDQLADRWFLSEFGSGNSLCTYVSQSPDPTGAYYSYQFSTPSFPDYPKYGVWVDAYYATTNESNPAVYALNRAAMLIGAPATAQRFTAPGLAGFGFEALTPSDLDGLTPPPAGAPNYVMRHVDTEAHNVPGYPANDILEIWAFSVNWASPPSSTFLKIADILTAEFDSTLCGLTSFYCMGMPGVPQGAPNSLDPLREVIMNRLAYRNFNTHEVLVGNFVTDIGSNIGGIRWFELRKTGSGPWSLYQEGTYAPTLLDNRWMGGIAMDGAGNIALGYNVSSQTIHPSIRYAGRLVSDPLGTLPQGEYTLVNGTANNGSNRYGDYSAMSIDPIDDCTFWFTGQWNDASQWKTRIGAFRFDACGSDNFTLSVTPASQQVCYPDDATYNVVLMPVADFTGDVLLSALGNPGTASFDPNPATPPGESILTISGASLGQSSFEVHGVSLDMPDLEKSQIVSLEVVEALASAPVLLSPPNGALNIPAVPTFEWNELTGAGSYTIQVAADPEFTNIIASASGLTDPTWTSDIHLNTSTTYYWRVWADNACGVGAYSPTWSFTTVAAPGDCGPGTLPNVVYEYGFESGEGDWTSSGTGNTWALSTLNPFLGANHFRGIGSATVSDQRLASPPVALPEDQNPVVLKFWHAPNLENNGATACYDGGILEISSDGGGSWSQVQNDDLLVGGYTGPVSTGFGNPLGGLMAWCGPNPQPYYQTIADLSSYAGQTVQFRMRLGTDSSVGRPGWDVDEVTVQSCQVDLTPAIELVKTVGTQAGVCSEADAITVAAGTEVTYCYTVENSGNVTLNFHTLEDSELGILFSDFNYALTPGESYSVMETVVISVTTVNTATWTANNAGSSHLVTSSASATVTVPTVAITEPLDGAVFTSLYGAVTIPVSIATTDFSLPEDGYWNLVLDGEIVEKVTGYTASVQLLTGTHTIRAELYTPDDLYLGILDSVTVTLNLLVPTVTILQPEDGQVFTSTEDSVTIPVVIATTDFSIPADGYWQLGLDGEMVGAVANYATEIQLSPGMHILSAKLYTADHIPVGVEATTTVTVNLILPLVEHQLFLPVIVRSTPEMGTGSGQWLPALTTGPEGDPSDLGAAAPSPPSTLINLLSSLLGKIMEALSSTTNQ